MKACAETAEKRHVGAYLTPRLVLLLTTAKLSHELSSQVGGVSAAQLAAGRWRML